MRGRGNIEVYAVFRSSAEVREVGEIELEIDVVILRM